jgi:uncharacterized BrkB/YihY/UPF0761 family membrane protein
VWGDPTARGAQGNAGLDFQVPRHVPPLLPPRELASNVGTWTGSFVLKTLVGLVSMFGWWLLVSLQLPHRGTSWRALVPGAILVAVGLELLSDVGAYLIATRVDSSQSAYGVLGVAAGLLFTLFVVSRIVVAAAVVNVTIWDGRRRPD